MSRPQYKEIVIRCTCGNHLGTVDLEEYPTEFEVEPCEVYSTREQRFYCPYCQKERILPEVAITCEECGTHVEDRDG